MKKHAFLILVHGHPEILYISIKKMLAPNHFFYIHVDEKSKLFFENSLIKELMLLPSVKFIENRVEVYWGGASQIWATVNLMKESIKQDDISYFHLISGQDLPLKSNFDFDACFKNNDINYCQSTDDFRPHLYMIYHLEFDKMYSLLHSKIAHRLTRLQFKFFKKGITIRPKLKFKQYHGSSWWSLNREIMSYILDYLKENSKYSRRFRYTCCCDEIFFQTLLMNSKFKNKINTSQRSYINWHDTTRGQLPVVLDRSDLDDINKSEALFMRKINYETSYELLCEMGYIDILPK